MFERILVPLDGSKVGEAALPHVEELVLKLMPKVKPEVILFHVVSSLTHYVIAGEVSTQVPYTEVEIEHLKKRSMSYLDRVAQDLKSKGITATSEVRIGRAAEEIIRACADFKIDLVAMSTHGRSGLSRLTFGSVTDKVLRAGSVPALVVRASEEDTKTQPTQRRKPRD